MTIVDQIIASPLDICVCGDPRKDHPNDGPCTFNDGSPCGHGYGGYGSGDGHFGAGECYGFKLELTADQDAAQSATGKGG